MELKSSDTELAMSLQKQLSLTEKNEEGTVIFLNGPWGSGKTFFWKNVLENKLVKNSTLYVSLFGVQNVADLRAKIVSAMLSGNEEKSCLGKGRGLLSKLNIPDNAFAVLKKFTGLDLKCDLLDLMQGRLSICFDDLERLPGTADIGEILGFINYLSEHKKYRCLVIVNEAEIKKSSHNESFYKLREKLGLRTFQLPFDLPARFQTFLTNKAKSYGAEVSAYEFRYLQEQIEHIKTDNLRTVKFILDCFLQMKSALKKEIPIGVAKFLVAMIDFESKGNSESEDFYNFNGYALLSREYVRQKNIDQRNKAPDKQTEFYLKYYGENSHYQMTTCVFNLVRNGYFDSNQALSEVFPIEANLTKSEKLAKYIQDIHLFYAEDSDLIKIINDVTDCFKTEKNLSFKTICIFARGLSSANKFLELPEPITLPEGFEAATVEAINKLEDPMIFVKDFGGRQNEISTVFSDFIVGHCRIEDRKRWQDGLNKAIAAGTTEGFLGSALQKPQILEQIFTSGQIESIWNSTNLRKEERNRLLEDFIKAMAMMTSQDSAGIVEQLVKTHAFLMQKYNGSTERMTRLRIFRLLQACGLELPQDQPRNI